MLYDWSKNLQLLALPLLTLSHQPPQVTIPEIIFSWMATQCNVIGLLEFLLWFENWMQDHEETKELTLKIGLLIWSQYIHNLSSLWITSRSPSSSSHPGHLRLNLLLLGVEWEKTVGVHGNRVPFNFNPLPLCLIWGEASSEQLPLLKQVDNCCLLVMMSLHKSKVNVDSYWKVNEYWRFYLIRHYWINRNNAQTRVKKTLNA